MSEPTTETTPEPATATTPAEQVGVAPAPPDLTGDALAARYCLNLADDALIYAQRLGEWISRTPQIEEDMALGNLGLDLLGQARALLTRAGELQGAGRTEDDLAYFRDEREFRNVHLVEQEGGDFGFEMVRLLWFSAYQLELYAALSGATWASGHAGATPGVPSSDGTIAGVARKAVKEVDYHRDHATQWVLRLGDGTGESHQRMTKALGRVAPYTSELFDDDPVSVAAADAGLGVLPSSLRERATGYAQRVLTEATLAPPEEPRWRSRGGREGIHSRPMGFLLAEMQHIARSHPGASW